MRSATKSVGDLGPALVLAPERWMASRADGGGEALGDLVVERLERATGDALRVVLDTTHARDGVVDVAAALRASELPKSHKKIARAGDLIVSRLRPYLRQIAYVHPAALRAAGVDVFAVSTEFYVLRAARAGGDLAALLPGLLSDGVQAALADAQEGGHHPRVPRESLLALRVPRATRASQVKAALSAHYAASEKLARALSITSRDAPAAPRRSRTRGRCPD